MLILKHPSPSMNPASQLGSFIFRSIIKGLETGLIFGKAYFNVSLNPKLIEDLILISLFKPYSVKWAFSFIK